MSIISWFWGPAPPWLQSLVAPLSDRLRLSGLPLHFHQLIISFLFYQSIHSFFSPFFSSRLFPQTYPSLNRRTRLNWDIHVVAFVQAIVISVLSLYVEFFDSERNAIVAPVDRMFGYSLSSGTVGTMAAGYFLWDTLVCLRYFKLFGPGMLAHGISALSVYFAGFRPFSNYYSSTFLLYELSSPFLNIHWFCDKLALTGSSIQWYNGMLLLASFLSARLVWGTYQSIRFNIDAWNAWNGTPGYVPVQNAIKATGNVAADLTWPNVEYGGVPTWLYLTFLLSNVTLNSLNWYWFQKMIDAVFKRFRPQPASSEKKKEDKKNDEVVAKEQQLLSDEVLVEAADKLLVHSEVGGAAFIGEDEEVVRRRIRRA
ncbi:hypothetical protein KEM56_002318 [Ascosphaera pollenicola]|nr:hypothetical protein KEM56_002318 [Ascosphaera pollenicola]